MLAEVATGPAALNEYGPVWILVSILLTAIGSLWGFGEWRRSRTEKKEEARKDRIVDIDERFKDKLADQFERHNEILDSQGKTLAVMAETQKQQGEMLEDLHKLSKEWSILSKIQAGPGGPTVKLPGAEPHLHVERPTS